MFQAADTVPDVPDVKIILNNEPIETQSDTIAKDFLSQDNGRVQLEILSLAFDIDVNPPMVQNVKLADTILAGYLAYPFKLSLEFACLDDCDFNWFVSDPDLDVGKLNSPKLNWSHR